MKAYIIIQMTKGVETPVILNPGYLDIKVAEKKLEELTAPRIAYYEWKNAQHSYVYNEAGFKEANPIPQVDWNVSYTMEEVDILHTHKNNNIAWTMLPSEVIYENGRVVNFQFTTKFSHAVDALVAVGMSTQQIESFFQTLGMNVYEEHVQLYLSHKIKK
jgi:hypothetical protein